MNARAEHPNPFAQQVVRSPHDARSTAESIHRKQFDYLLGLFSALGQAPVQRLQRGPLAQLVQSQQPGSGKSHLLGRLWSDLADRAVVIYLRAHEDRFGFWQRILERLMLELEHPLDVETEASVTRLDGLARHLLADLLFDAMQQGRVASRDPQGTAAAVRIGVQAALDKLRQQLPQLLTPLIAQLQRRLREAGLELAREADAWLKVLTHYTLNPANTEVRTLAVYWMQGNPLEPAEYEKLGLNRAQSSGALVVRPEDLPPNETALRCLCNLCAFGAWFRPFIFAFDQTEIYGQTPELASAFGVTIERLWSECVNKLIVVTANEQPWRNSVWNHFKTADQDRFDPSVVQIKGIGRNQARELVTVKMREAGYAQERIEKFLGLPWFDKLFPSSVALPLPRLIERDASLALPGWLAGEAAGPDAKSVNDDGAHLQQVFEDHRLRILRTPGATDFDIGVLQWMLSTGFSGLPGFVMEPKFRAPRGYLSARWRCADGSKLYFVLNNSTHWKRWAAIVREFHEHLERDRAEGGSGRGLVLWHRSLKAIGEGMRKQLAASEARGLDVLELSDEEVPELYAGQAVFADLRQGDLEHVDQDVLIAFLGTRLRHWGERFQSVAKPPVAIPPPPPSPAAVPSQVLAELVRNAHMLAWPVLRSRFAERGLEPSIEQVLLACQPLAAQIKVFSTPSNHLFVWQQTST